MSAAAPRPVPEPDAASAPFWDAAARHVLVVQRCAGCNRYRHPPRPLCPSCGSPRASFAEVSGEARIWSWIVAHPPVLPAFADAAPYVVVVAELPEGVRMIGRLLEAAPANVQDGLPLRVAFEDVEPGVALPAWRPA